MPSFTRRAPATAPAPPPGTHPSPSSASLNVLPTGLPSMDDLLGSGLPLGSVLLVLAPDHHSAWSRLVQRYFLAKGLLSGQGVAMLGNEGEAREVLRGCMWVEGGTNMDEGGTAGQGAGGESGSEGELPAGGKGEQGEGRGGGKIAWRYEGMKKFRTTVDGKGKGRELNLTTTIPAELLKAAEAEGALRYIDPCTSGAANADSSAAGYAASVLRELHGHLSQAPGDTALRIAVHELGSPDWLEPSTPEIHRFLHSLQHLIRNKNAAAIVTLPSQLARAAPADWAGDLEGWIQSLSWAVDASVELRGFAGLLISAILSARLMKADDPTLADLFPHSHGLLTLHSFPTTHALLPPSLKHSSLLGVSQSASASAGLGGTGAGENNLGFKLKRKRWVVETVHLGVEGGVGERRTEPAVDTSVVQPYPAGPDPRSHHHGAAEGLEPKSAVSDHAKPQADEGVEKPRGPKEGKERRRVKVSFGGEQVIEEDQATRHGHGDHNHSVPHRPVVRHDQPDLYEF